jgi:hypothetical protein
MIPLWLSAAFCVAILLPVLLLAQTAREAALPTQRRVVFGGVVVAILTYFGYVVAASLGGLFSGQMVPPAVLRYATLPYALLLFGGIFPTAWFKRFIGRIPTESLIRLHRFRVVGTFFLFLAYFGALPLPFALVAGLGDLLTALSSSWVARLVKQQHPHARRVALFWNTFGLLDILFTAISANVLTYLAMNGQTTANVEVLGSFPFCLIPAFAPPTILLIHVLIFKRLC